MVHFLFISQLSLLSSVLYVYSGAGIRLPTWPAWSYWSKVAYQMYMCMKRTCMNWKLIYMNVIKVNLVCQSYMVPMPLKVIISACWQQFAKLSGWKLQLFWVSWLLAKWQRTLEKWRNYRNDSGHTSSYVTFCLKAFYTSSTHVI